YAASYASIDILMVLAVYYFTYYLGTPQYMYHLTLAVMMLTMIIVLPIYYTLSKRFSIRLLYGCALLIWGSGLVWGYCMMQPGSHWGIILGAGAYLGSGMAGAMMLPWAIFPTVTDIGEYFTGENRAGMYAGVLTLIRKLVQGVLVMPLIAITLYSIGYIPQLFPQAPAVAVGLQRMFFFAPLIFIAIGLIAVIRLPLTQARTAILQETLAKLRSGIQTDRIDAAASKQLNRLL
ncbi:MAG: MFS transporter, partial [Spirochaeta sp.]